MYKLTHTNTVIRTTDGASIPTTDERNSDYQEYLKWRDGWTEEIRQLKQVTTVVNHLPEEEGYPDFNQVKHFIDTGVCTLDDVDSESFPNFNREEYLKWLSGWEEQITSLEMKLIDTIVREPHTPEPADPLPPPVYVLDAAQFRINLRKLGIRQQVEDAIAASGNGELQDLWEYKTELHSDNQALVAFAASIGMSDKLTEVFTLKL